MRLLNRSLAGGVTFAIAACAPAQQQQQQPDGWRRPSQAEVVALATCEGTELPRQGQSAQVKSGVYDRLHGQWLIVGEKRDEIIDCLVARHGWTAQNLPDGRRAARAP